MGKWIAVGSAVVLAVVAVVAVVKGATGYSSFDIANNGFSYRVAISDVRRPTSVNGSIAKPGFSFVQIIMKVANQQSDRMAPLIDSIDAIAAAPGTFTISGTSITGAQYCVVGGSGSGQVSTGVAGAPPGWCFLTVAADQSAQTSYGPIAAGGTIYQTYDSATAFSENVDLSTFHVYGQTGGSDTVRSKDIDLGAAG